MQWRDTVQREDNSKPKGFSPQSQQAQVGDAVFWYNEDSGTSHQPYPNGGEFGDWVPAIAPQHSSEQLDLDTAGTYEYQCANHDDENGQIIVAVPVAIGPSGTGDATVAPPKASAVAGQCVSWGNSDPNAHWPTPDQGPAWFAQAIQPGDISAPITFAVAGVFTYRCAIHPDAVAEQGTINVTES